jgi:DNA mismatch repair ATPase MutS
VPEPDYFRDLNLDQVVASITVGRDSRGLAPLFYETVCRPDSVAYRQEVFRDLDGRESAESLDAFAGSMRLVAQRMGHANRIAHPHQRSAWHLAAADIYCAAVLRLDEDLAEADLTSRGLEAWRGYLAEYVRSPAFLRLLRETRTRMTDLAAVTYCLEVTDDQVRVSRYHDETDYGEDVERTFVKFRQGRAQTHLMDFDDSTDLNRVEAAVLDRVARLYPETFSALEKYADRHLDFVDETVSRFNLEIEFYLAYLDYLKPLRRAGLAFCYPKVSVSKHVRVDDMFDLALADKNVSEASPVVCNNLALTGAERIVVVSGPNQGGKTTFARTVGQLHHLAALGCPVPGRVAELFLFDELFTHFQKEETLEDRKGRLEDELVRVRKILDRATGDSIVIMNELFTSTTLADARYLGARVLQKLSDLDALGVCVTFVDEFATLNAKVVSLVATVDPVDPAARTFKIERRSADGNSYAETIARHHGLTYAMVRRRLTG